MSNQYELAPGYPDYSREEFEKERMEMESYRDLEIGEVIEMGDEYKHGLDWLPAATAPSIGNRLTRNHNRYRRPLTQPEVLPGDDNCGCGSPLHDTHGNRKAEPDECWCNRETIPQGQHTPLCPQYRRKAETRGVSVELVIVDFGECCAINVVSGQFDYPMHPMFDRINFRGTAAILAHSFADIKEQIDLKFNAPPPVPRIERENLGVNCFAVYHEHGSYSLDSRTYKHLSQIVGKDIHIYSPPQTKWERLGTPAGIQMWRFTTGG